MVLINGHEIMTMYLMSIKYNINDYENKIARKILFQWQGIYNLQFDGVNIITIITLLIVLSTHVVNAH